MIQSLCDNFAFFKMLKKASCLLKQIHGLMKLTWTLKNRFVKYVSISLGPVRNDLVITRNFRYIHRVWCSSYRKLGLVSYSSVQQISARSFGKKMEPLLVDVNSRIQLLESDLSTLYSNIYILFYTGLWISYYWTQLTISAEVPSSIKENWSQCKTDLLNPILDRLL